MLTGKYKYNRNDIDLDPSVVDELKGVHYLEKSAGIRRGSTALSLADHYHQANSDRVMGENGKRIYWLKRAAELGVAKAAYALASIYIAPPHASPRLFTKWQQLVWEVHSQRIS